jgi:hypothetical protein
MHDVQASAVSPGKGNGPWAGLDSIADEHSLRETEDGPSAWDPQLDPSRGRELWTLSLMLFSLRVYHDSKSSHAVAESIHSRSPIKPPTSP